MVDDSTSDFRESSGDDSQSKTDFKPNNDESVVSEVVKNEIELEDVSGKGRLEKSEAVNEKVMEKDGAKSKIPLFVFFIGLWARIREGIEKMMSWKWLSWWPFWRQEKRLEQLLTEADANPKDAAMQSALLAELNKHRFSPVMIFSFSFIFLVILVFPVFAHLTAFFVFFLSLYCL